MKSSENNLSPEERKRRAAIRQMRKKRSLLIFKIKVCLCTVLILLIWNLVKLIL